MEEILKEVKFDEKGLVPAIIQDAQQGEVLMVAYMNRLALEKTLETGYTHFWSRSRNRLWKKGEESGHVQKVEEILIDCDSDTLLVKVHQEGAACHTGHRSCFFRRLDREGWQEKGEKVFNPQEVYGGGCTILEHIYEVILDRKHHIDRQDSYVASLFRKGLDAILKKVGEEATEVVLAGKDGDRERVVYEVADLFFHTLVAMGYYNVPPSDVYGELGRRFGRSGLEEKEERRER